MILPSWHDEMGAGAIPGDVSWWRPVASHKPRLAYTTLLISMQHIQSINIATIPCHYIMPGVNAA